MHTHLKRCFFKPRSSRILLRPNRTAQTKQQYEWKLKPTMALFGFLLTFGIKDYGLLQTEIVNGIEALRAVPLLRLLRKPRRRPGHPRPKASQGGVREVAVVSENLCGQSL